MLPLAGFAAGRGEFSVLTAIIWTTAGSVVGALALYLIGMLASDEWLRRTLAKMPLVHERDVVKAEQWFDRNGRLAVFVGRMIPGVRSFVSIPAGQRRMPWHEFTGLTLLGSLIWNAVFVGGGYALGSRWHLVGGGCTRASSRPSSVVVLGALVLTMLIRRYRRHREVKPHGGPDPGDRAADLLGDGSASPCLERLRALWRSCGSRMTLRTRTTSGATSTHSSSAQNSSASSRPSLRGRARRSSSSAED